MVEIVLSDWFMHHPSCPEVEALRLIARIAAMRKDGVLIHTQWSSTGLRQRFVASFETEDEAAIFKLTYL